MNPDPEKVLDWNKANFSFPGQTGKKMSYIWDPDFTTLFTTSDELPVVPVDEPMPLGGPTTSGDSIVNPGPPLGVSAGVIAGIIVGCFLGLVVISVVVILAVTPLRRIVFPYSRVGFCCCKDQDEFEQALEEYQQEEWKRTTAQ